MLFQVIQESVDLIYFLEEDTIAMANTILDHVIMKEIRSVVLEAVRESKIEQKRKLKQYHSLGPSDGINSSSCIEDEDDDSLQVIQDDEDCLDKQSNI